MSEEETIIPHRPKSIEYIRDKRDVPRAIKYLHRFDVLGFDVETHNTFDTSKPAFDPEWGARMRLAQFGTRTGRAFVFDLVTIDPKEIFYNLFPNNFVCLIHNASFELKFLMYELGIYKYGPIFDTMICEQILAQGRVSYSSPGYVAVGLAPTVKRALGIELSKEEQAGAWFKEELTESQLLYAAQDAQVLLPLHQHQLKRLKEQGQIRAAEIEFKAIPAFVFMMNTGITMDTESWIKRCEANESKLETLTTQLQYELGSQQTLFEGAVNSININSRPKIMQAMKAKGIHIPIDRDGKRTLGASYLEDQRHIPAVDLYCQYVKVHKALTSYGYKWLDKISPFDNKLHTKIKQIGTETGRASSPDMLLIPRDDGTRNCFIADEEWVFVDTDFSQCELRILAELCRDSNLLKAFDEDKDLHRFSAHLIYKVPFDEVTSKQRGTAKNLNFGIVYGIGAKKFAMDSGLSQEVGQGIMDFYLKKAYPKMGQWLEAQASSVFAHMKAYTSIGRTRWYMGDLRDNEFKASVQRNAKNFPVQAGNADITKRALALVYEKIVDNNYQDFIKIILVIHDEILLMARPYAVELAKRIQVESMLQAESEFLRRVPPKVDTSIMLRWSKEPNEELQLETDNLIKDYVQL